jgi:hypothetical protein
MENFDQLYGEDMRAEAEKIGLILRNGMYEIPEGYKPAGPKHGDYVANIYFELDFWRVNWGTGQRTRLDGIERIQGAYLPAEGGATL